MEADRLFSEGVFFVQALVDRGIFRNEMSGMWFDDDWHSGMSRGVFGRG